MAKPIVLANVGAAFWMIAILGAGVAKCLASDVELSIEWNDDKLRDDSDAELFNKLNNEKLRDDVDVEPILEAVGDKDNIRVGGISVSELLALRDPSQVGCHYEQLKKLQSRLNQSTKIVERGHAFTFYCTFHFANCVITCIQKIVADVDALVVKDVDQSKRDVLQSMFSKVTKLKTGATKRDYVTIINDLANWNHQTQKQYFTQLLSACAKLNDILDQINDESYWFELGSLLGGEPLPSGWFDVGLACAVFLNLEDDKVFTRTWRN